MAAITSVYDFVAKARSRNLDDNDIRHRLFNAGWSASDIDAILSDDLVPPPPPDNGSAAGAVQTVARESTSLTGLESFMMLLAMGISAIAGGVLLHTLVSVVLGSEGQTGEAATAAVAFLIVSLPVFAVLFVRLRRAEARDVSVLTNEGRRRALQVTLVVTFLVALGRLVAWLVGLLSPEFRITDASPAEDLVHVGVTVLLAGSVFAWSWREFQRSEVRRARAGSIQRAVVSVGALLVLAVGASIAQAVVTSGARHDDLVASDLYSVHWALERHLAEGRALPATLASLELDPVVASRIDQNGVTYEPTGVMSYELCAEFETDTGQVVTGRYFPNFDQHPTGRVCFEQEI